MFVRNQLIYRNDVWEPTTRRYSHDQFGCALTYIWSRLQGWVWDDTRIPFATLSPFQNKYDLHTTVLSRTGRIIKLIVSHMVGGHTYYDFMNDAGGIEMINEREIISRYCIKDAPYESR